MKLGLLQDPRAIDRQIKREAAEAEEKRRRASLNVQTVKTEAETKAEEEAREREVKFIEGKVKNDEKKRGLKMIRPLSDSKAIDMGANFISEAFVFGVAVALLLFETWRSRRKDSNRREDVQEKLDWLEDEIKLSRQEKGLLEEQVSVLRGELEALKHTPDPSAARTSTLQESIERKVEDQRKDAVKATKSSNANVTEEN